MAMARETAGNLPSKIAGKYKFTPPVPTPVGPKTPVAAGKTYAGAKSVGKPVFTPPSKSSYTKPSAPSSKASYTKPTPASAPKVKPTFGGEGAFGKEAYTGAGSSGTYSSGGYGGAKTGVGPSSGTSYGGSSSQSNYASQGPVGGNFGATTSAPVVAKSNTPSQIAALALSNLAGRDSAPMVSRRRNRAGAGYNTSLSPEQLRSIAARRVGGG